MYSFLSERDASYQAKHQIGRRLKCTNYCYPNQSIESSIRVVNMKATQCMHVISATQSSGLATLKKDVVDGRAAVPSMIQRRTRWIERACTPRMVTAGQTHTHCIRAAIPSQVYTRFMGRARRIFLCWQRRRSLRRRRWSCRCFCATVKKDVVDRWTASLQYVPTPHIPD